MYICADDAGVGVVLIISVEGVIFGRGPSSGAVGLIGPRGGTTGGAPCMTTWLANPARSGSEYSLAMVALRIIHRHQFVVRAAGDVDFLLGGKFLQLFLRHPRLSFLASALSG